MRLELPRLENLYYLDLMQMRAPVMIRLKDGSIIRGRPLWYGRASLRVKPKAGIPLLLFKHAISSLQDVV